HTTIRYFLAGLAAAMLVFLILEFSPEVSAENAKFTVCRNKISSRCLTDLGVEIALDARSLPPYMREVGMLAQMGRIEDALALELRVVNEKERPPANAEEAANRRLASHRITAAIRAGENLETSIDGTPAVDPGVLWISALDLLGRDPYGVSIGPRITPDERVLDVVSDMAERIAGIAEQEPDHPRTSHLMYAAELQAALGNRTSAIQLLEVLPQTENPLRSPTEDLMRLVGPQNVLRLYHEAGGSRPNALLTAASAETDMGRAAKYLERAFSEFSSEKPWPDFDWMERTVERAANLGLEELALQLARELADQAKTAQSGFPVFPHIKAARALMVAGAGEHEVQESLALAQSLFPRNGREIVGLGVVSGAIAWVSSGLDAEARREIANLRARLGEIDAAIQIMDGIDDPVFAWNDMLTPDISVEYLSDLFDAARGVLSREEHAYIRAQHAQELLFFGRTENQRLWARATATDLLHAEQFDGDRSVIVYSSLARVGAQLEDQDIQQSALERLAEAALMSRDFSDLIAAGFQWYQSDYKP
ncbi:MAG: hypothetical protein WBA92_04530, partial [Pseudorhodobacter sp.]